MADKLKFMVEELGVLKEEQRFINIRTMDSPADGESNAPSQNSLPSHRKIPC